MSNRTTGPRSRGTDLVLRRGRREEIVLTPLDAAPEPASLLALRAAVEALLPEVEIADLPAEVHAWTGFRDEYTHIGGISLAEK
jgi:hypothetical protein